jgi:outer membrane murein-binding lipoprotein Lpp
MNKYLLLRDNKQSGPYTVEELVSKGIKAYDLVWVEGKSAAWRYPSEISELKAYAPVVEEQPFERFYKKPVAEKLFTEEREESFRKNLERNAEVQPVAEHRNHETIRSNPEQIQVNQPVGQTSINESSIQVNQPVGQASINESSIQVNQPVGQTLINESSNQSAKIQFNKPFAESAFNNSDHDARIEKPARDPFLYSSHSAVAKASNESAKSPIVTDSQPSEEIVPVVQMVTSQKQEEKPMVTRKVYVNFPSSRPVTATNDKVQVDKPVSSHNELAPGASNLAITAIGQAQTKNNNDDQGISAIKPTVESISQGSVNSKPVKQPTIASTPKKASVDLEKYQPKPVEPESPLETTSLGYVPPASSYPKNVETFSKPDFHPQSEIAYHAPTSNSRRPIYNLLVKLTVAASLLLGGIVIGLALNSSTKSAKLDELSATVRQIQEQQKAAASTQAQPKSVPEPPIPASEEPSSAATQPEAPIGKTVSVTQPPPVKPSPVQTEINQTADNRIEENVSETEDLSRIERNLAAKEIDKKNLMALLSLENEKYKTGVLGGISDLRLRLSNKSLYNLEQVEVEVRFLGPEKKIVKSQTVYFENVSPGQELTIEVPKSNRGVTVDYSIKRVNSRELGVASGG